MENDILDALEDLGYSGAVQDEVTLEKALEGGPKSVEYTALVEWASKELQSFCQLEEHVNVISSAEDSSSFLLELSSFLKELGCVYTQLTEGHMTDRLATRKNRILLLDYLLTELEAARMIVANKPDQAKMLQVQLKESSTAGDLKTLLIALKFPKPPANITPRILFEKVETKLKEVLAKASPDLIGKPLFFGVLSDKQWHHLETVQFELQDEYKLRREMLIKRLDVTIQSFRWSERMKGKEDQIADLFLPRRKVMSITPNIQLSDLLAAREDLAVIEKTSNASVRKNTQSSINKIIIGRVPDRGGRPSEQQPPPPEMPSWQQTRSGGPGGGAGGGRGGGRGGDRGGGRGGGGDRGGGRVQGGWNQGNQSGGYQDRGGGFQGGNVGGYQGGSGGAYQGGGGYQGGSGGYQGGNYQGGRGRGGRGGWNRGGGGRQDSYR